MHKTALSLGFVFATALVGCSSQPAAQMQTPGASEPAPTDRGPGELFGDPLDEGLEVVTLDKLITEPDTFNWSTVETRGMVRASCQIRGCWMEVRAMDDVASSAVTVRFKNYGFFVPLDSRGAEVRFQGVFKSTTYTADQVKELEGEGGSFDHKNADGSANVLGFTATGVEMWRTE